MPRYIQLGARFLLLASLVAGSGAHAAEAPSAPATLLKLFQPPALTLVALAPDGRHVAYTVRETVDDEVEWSIVIVDVASGRDTVLPIREEPRNYPGASVQTLPPITVSYLQWSSAGPLLYYNGWAVRSVDSQGKNDRRLVDQYDVGISIAGGAVGWTPRPIRVENLLPDDSGTLVISVAGRYAETFLLDLKAGTWKSLGQFSEGGNYVRDLQGRPRIRQSDPIVIPTGGPPPPFPFVDPQGVRFYYRDGLAKESRDPILGLRHWDPLETILGKGSELTFNFHPEKSYEPRAVPLGFGKDPNILYYSSDLGRDTHAIHALDLHSKTSTLVLADPTVDLANAQATVGRQGLVIDRLGNLAGVRVNAMQPHTVWLDRELAAFQARLDDRLPGHQAEIIDWDKSGATYLVSVTGPSEPGGYWVADASDLTKPKLVLSRSKDPTARFNPSTTFEFDSPAGIHLTGTITRPLASRINPAPAVFYLHPIPGRATGGFNRVTQALATLGFVVIDVNYRGSTGFGAALRNGLKENPDAPVEDILATLAWVKANYPIDAKRVGLYGDDLGGYFAVRALELHPETFRAGVARRPPESINDWIAEGGTLINPRRALLGWNSSKYSSYSILQPADNLMRPLLLISGTTRENFSVKLLAFTLKNDLIKPETITRTDYVDRDNGWVAEPELYLRIGAFLNESFFNYESSIGELKVLE